MILYAELNLLTLISKASPTRRKMLDFIMVIGSEDDVLVVFLFVVCGGGIGGIMEIKI